LRQDQKFYRWFGYGAEVMMAEEIMAKTIWAEAMGAEVITAEEMRAELMVALTVNGFFFNIFAVPFVWLFSCALILSLHIDVPHMLYVS